MCAAALLAWFSSDTADAKPRRGKRAEHGKQSKRSKRAKRARRASRHERGDEKTDEKTGKRIKIAVTTVLRARPGETAKSVAPVDAGTEVRVIERDGRWIKVRAGEHVGWITRTLVERVVAKRERNRGAGRWKRRAREIRASSTPVEEITAPAAAGDDTVVVVAQLADVYARPSAGALVKFRVHSGEMLAVIGYANERRWVRVDAGEGQTGWVTAGVVGQPGAVRSPKRSRAPESDSDQSERPSIDHARPPAPLPRLAVRGGVDLGFRSLGMDFTSDVQAGLGNYLVSAQSATVGVGGEIRRRVGSFGVVGVDGEYRVGYSSPGIRYEGSNGRAGDIAFSSHEVRASGFAGMRIGEVSPMEVVARAGYHYDVFLVDQLGNVGRLPNESLAGPTAGILVSLPRLDDALALAAGVDALVSGTRSQTPGLEDGETSEISAVWARLSLTYRWSRSLELSGHYGFGRAHTRWTGMSARVPDVIGAERTDSSHTLSLALGARL